LVRRVWIEEGKRPVVRISGSHQYSCFFGAVDIKGKQLFRQYNKFNADTFLDFLKIIHSKFPRCYLFLDKAPQHYKSRKVKDYLKENKDSHTGIPADSVSRVYDARRGVEYSQT
jgi:hypothetical protein